MKANKSSSILQTGICIVCSRFVPARSANVGCGAGKRHDFFSLNIITILEKDFQLDAYVQWSPLSIEEWLIMGEMLPVKLKTGTFLLGGKVWLSVENGRLMDVRGAINAPKLLLTSVAQNIAPVEDLQTAFWRRNEGLGQNSWRLVLQEFGFKWQDEVLFQATGLVIGKAG